MLNYDKISYRAYWGKSRTAAEQPQYADMSIRINPYQGSRL